MSKKVILIAGYMRTGKTSFANACDDVTPNVKLAFAGPLKKICRDIFVALGYPIHTIAQLEILKERATYIANSNEIVFMSIIAACVMLMLLAGNFMTAAFIASICFIYSRVFTPVTVRQILIAVGTAMRKHVDPDVFVLAACREIKDGAGSVYVLQDCRFPNEVAVIADNATKYGYEIHVVRIHRFVDGVEVKAPFDDASERPDLVVEEALKYGIQIHTVMNDCAYDEFTERCRQACRDITKK